MQLGKVPRVDLAHLPTPLEPLPRLSAALKGPRLFIKRDDATGLALGGNKTRKLEFLMGEAVQLGIDTVITGGGVQSNHVRQTAAAAAKLGMKCELVLNRNVPRVEPGYDRTGNIQLDRLLGATVHIHPAETDRDTVMDRLAADIRARGGHPYVVPIGGSNAVGATGYVNAALELTAQSKDSGTPIDSLVLASSSGGTVAGLSVGFAAMNHPVRVTGIDVDGDPGGLDRVIVPLLQATARRLGIGSYIPLPELDLDHAGEGYGLPTEAMREAVEMTARLEGILLDPVYSGKAMAGLIARVRDGRYRPDENVVFLHSGGMPALFAYRSVFDPDLAP